MYYSYSNDIGDNTDRIIIIGDVHGDIKRFKDILIKSEIINTNLEWIAEPPNTYIILLDTLYLCMYLYIYLYLHTRGD